MPNLSKTIWITALISTLISFWVWYPKYLEKQAMYENEDSTLYYGDGEYVSGEEHRRLMYEEETRS